ncbi:hypothetical protein K438DRAFT_967918 [Mycena galopus ATCC 62051]|nr:hypothetical protein K438DRAFT_967918 [Mycena galopus ATCC 62051]
MFSLPNELIVAIAAAAQEDRVWGVLPAFKPEWTLSHLSRRFRFVIIGAPALWKLVDIALHSQGSLEILGLYLRRSQGCIISAVFEHRSPLKEKTERHLVAEFSRQMVPHVDRIWRLRVVVKGMRGEFLLSPFRDRAALKLQHLEILNLIGDDRNHVDMFWAGAPKLKFLVLYDMKLQLPVSQWAPSLTHLELRRDRLAGGGNSKTLHDFMSQCPSLVYLYLDVTFAPLGRRFLIPSLKSLYIKVSGFGDSLLDILDAFDTPSLAEFTIQGFHGHELMELFVSTRLPHASFPALTSLCFANAYECTCNVSLPTPSHTPFQLFPALNSLSLIDACQTSDLIKAIVVPTSGALVPRSIALSPMAEAVEDVRDAVLGVIRSYSQQELPAPRFRFSPALASLEDWQEHGIEMEAFDATGVLDIFRAYP